MSLQKKIIILICCVVLGIVIASTVGGVLAWRVRRFKPITKYNSKPIRAQKKKKKKNDKRRRSLAAYNQLKKINKYGIV